MDWRSFLVGLIVGWLAEFIIDFVSGGAYSLLTQWIMSDMPYSAEQMGALLHELTGGYANIIKQSSL